MPDYSEQIAQLITEATQIQSTVHILRAHLQQQFGLEFDEGSESHNRGMLYAQCGTSCQAIEHTLNGIIEDLKLIDDMDLHPETKSDVGIPVQIF